MTPLYDVLTAQKAVADGQIRHNRMRLAMCVGDQNHYRINEVVKRHFLETAKTVGLGGDLAENAINELLGRIPAAIVETERALPGDFPRDLMACTWEGVEARMAALAA